MTVAEQRDASLNLANEVRRKRSQLKKNLKSGKVKVAELIVDPPQLIHTMTAEDLLMALPSFGKERVQKALRLVTISPSKQIGTMTMRQRSALLWGIQRHQPRSQK